MIHILHATRVPENMYYCKAIVECTETKIVYCT